MHLNSRFVMWNDWKDWNGWNSKNDWNDWNQPNRQTSENYVELILYQILQHRAHFSTRNKNHASVMLTLANTQNSYKKTPLLLVGFICGLFEVPRYILGRTHDLKKLFCATVDVEKNSKVSNKNTRLGTYHLQPFTAMTSSEWHWSHNFENVPYSIEIKESMVRNEFTYTPHSQSQCMLLEST